MDHYIVISMFHIGREWVYHTVSYITIFVFFFSCIECRRTSNQFCTLPKSIGSPKRARESTGKQQRWWCAAAIKEIRRGEIYPLLEFSKHIFFTIHD